MSDLPPLDDPAEHASVRIVNVASELDSFARAAGEVNDVNHLAHYLASLRDLRQQLAAVYDEIERALLVAMPDKKAEVPYLGIIERKKSTRRTAWNHEDLFRSVLSRIADEPGVFYDPEDGAMIPPAQMAANLVARLREVLSPSWKVGGIRSLGLAPDEFCTEDEAVQQIVLPPRQVA